MKLIAALAGNLDQMLADEVRIAEQAVTHSIREATDGLKTELRSQVTGAGLGQRLANTWRGEVYPKGKLSIKAAGLVYSRAPVIVGAHDQGATIRSKDGFWLAIPLPAAGKGPRGKRMTPGLWEKLRGQRLGEPDHAGLGGGVVRLPAVARDAGHRRQADHPPAGADAAIGDQLLGKALRSK